MIAGLACWRGIDNLFPVSHIWGHLALPCRSPRRLTIAARFGEKKNLPEGTANGGNSLKKKHLSSPPEGGRKLTVKGSTGGE